MKLALCSFAVTLALAPTSLFASSLTVGYFIGGAFSEGGQGQRLVPQGPQTTVSDAFRADHRVNSPFPSFPMVADLTFQGSVSAFGTYDAMHLTAESNAIVGGNFDPAFGFHYATAFANIGFESADALSFTSTSLAPGTPISFRVTQTLDSLFQATAPGTCQAAGYNPAGTATLQILDSNNAFLFNPLSHDTCGRGSEIMTASVILQSAVGGRFAFQTAMTLTTYTGANNTAPRQALTSADASHTGSTMIEVLTPGVDFIADSGASYAVSTSPSAPVPEPGTILLTLTGLAVAGRRRWSIAKGNANGSCARAPGTR